MRHPATDELLAGALFIKHDGGLIYLFAAASAAGRAAGALLLLLDEAIGRHAGQPGQVLDFEGGSLPAIGRFFANFGARPVLYPASAFESSWFLVKIVCPCAACKQSHRTIPARLALVRLLRAARNDNLLITYC
ncbi:MAG: hypothetical protein WKG07_01465 [Hymenobacter sp.]